MIRFLIVAPEHWYFGAEFSFSFSKPRYLMFSVGIGFAVMYVSLPPR